MLRLEFSENNATATRDSNPPPLKKIMANRTTEPTQALQLQHYFLLCESAWFLNSKVVVP